MFMLLTASVLTSRIGEQLSRALLRLDYRQLHIRLSNIGLASFAFATEIIVSQYSSF